VAFRWLNTVGGIRSGAIFEETQKATVSISIWWNVIYQDCRIDFGDIVNAGVFLPLSNSYETKN
jgi:hypothetical protein